MFSLPVILAAVVCVIMYFIVAFFLLPLIVLSETHRKDSSLKICAMALFWLPLLIVGPYLLKRRRRLAESEALSRWGEVKECISCKAKALPTNAFGVRCLNCGYLN
jgi:hypothetical protein